ncbi:MULTISPECIES: hypothetical protein [Gordonia]|uniref:Uncharacterized protein n=1 Tax=Gordonia terrae C-6 TaxID=1316928 RepID=R7Y4P8_9ACTN|nr:MULTISPECIES: hypothetical protein [Gordonia]AFR47769.1 hypothetical protein KTR9_1126 [Gordonia sp. KTR9]EON31028.1 hypothetical protein GTC6_19755 [Gordonia terrae C-6]
MLDVANKSGAESSTPGEAGAGTGRVVKSGGRKKHYVDNGWPQDDNGDAAEHAVSELATHISGALSPFGDTEFPLPVDELPFVQSKTVVNR